MKFAALTSEAVVAAAEVVVEAQVALVLAKFLLLSLPSGFDECGTSAVAVDVAVVAAPTWLIVKVFADVAVV